MPKCVIELCSNIFSIHEIIFAMNKMKLTHWIGLFIFAIHLNVSALEWLTDVPMALERAKAENKVVLLDFTGSDWCGWCIKLKSEVFDQPAFAAFAQNKLIMVELDFPRKPQTAELRANNEAWKEKFEIAGYPTIILLDAYGNKLMRTGYRAGGPANYIAHLETIPALKNKIVAPGAAPSDKTLPTVAPAPPARPTELTLKAIVGAKTRRLALVNDQTLGVGEKGTVKLESGPVEIVCKEIRDDSVLILVKGDATPKELKLKAAAK